MYVVSAFRSRATTESYLLSRQPGATKASKPAKGGVVTENSKDPVLRPVELAYPIRKIVCYWGFRGS